MAPVFLVARREYLAYVTAWGFWVSLITAPLLFAALIFAPLLLARAEPPRALAIVAEQSADARNVEAGFEREARTDARAEIEIYLEASAPGVAERALAAFDAAPDRASAIVAARVEAGARAAAFPSPAPRYFVVPAPGADIEALKPYLSGERTLADGRALFGALNIRRDQAGAPSIEYWSANLQHDEPTSIARRAMRLEMQREALAAQGLARGEADRLAAFEPKVAQFDPRPSAGASGEVTLRQRAPFFAAIGLSLVLWTVVFSVANMLLSGVIEEKSNKILDTLLTSVTPIDLLLGKLLGVAAVSATLFVFWGGLGASLMQFAPASMGDSFIGQLAAAFAEPRLVVAFAVGFVTGYLMFGAIFLALGSLCESIQEAQTLLGPVTIILMLPMLLIGPAVDNPNSPLIQAASWVPLFTPFLMLIRAPTGLSWAEIAGQGALLLATVALLLFLAAQVFRAGIVNQLSVTALFGRKKQRD